MNVSRLCYLAESVSLSVLDVRRTYLMLS